MSLPPSPLLRPLALLAAIFGLAVAVPAQTPATLPSLPSRDQAIRTTLDALAQELRAHGGSYEHWSSQLQPFRDDLEHIRSTQKWPWPAKSDFKFEGKEMTLLLAGDLSAQPEGQRPFDTIVSLDRQLKARGIDLVLMPIPDKLSVYPDYLSALAPDDRNVALPTRRLLKQLLEAGVEVIDLAPPYAAYRREHEDKLPLFYDRDAHWRNRGAVLAAQAITTRLARYDFVREAQAGVPLYTTRPHRRDDGPKADDVVIVVNQQTGASYGDVPNSPVIITGDSFGLYNTSPTANGSISAHVARGLNLPVTLLSREGLSGDLPLELAKLDRRDHYLTGRRVIVWSFCTRMFVAAKWPVIDLPSGSATRPTTASAATLPAASVLAVATITECAPAPDPKAPYTDYILKLSATLRPSAGQQALPPAAVLHLLAMKNRALLPPATLRPGQRITVRLTPWSALEPTLGTTNTSTLPDAKSELDLPHYFAQLETPPSP